MIMTSLISMCVYFGGGQIKLCETVGWEFFHFNIAQKECGQINSSSNIFDSLKIGVKASITLFHDTIEK